MNGKPAFRLVRPETVWVDVRAAPPGGAEAHCRLELRYRSMSERAEMRERLAAGGVSDAEALRTTVVGWSNVAGEEGEPLEFSAEALADALDLPWFFAAARNALAAELWGAALGGNSVAPAGDGQPASGT